jgi:limonene-1,2-epoxide hydrolase
MSADLPAELSAVGGDPAALLRAFGAALERGDPEAAATCFAPEAVYEEPPRFAFAGRAAIAEFVRDFAARHTNVRFEVVRVLAGPADGGPADGTLAAAEWRFSHTRAADGVHAAYAGMSFVELAGGRITRWRGYSALVG